MCEAAWEGWGQQGQQIPLSSRLLPALVLGISLQMDRQEQVTPLWELKYIFEFMVGAGCSWKGSGAACGSQQGLGTVCSVTHLCRAE